MKNSIVMSNFTLAQMSMSNQTLPVFKSPVVALISELNWHSKCIDHQLEMLYQLSNGDAKFDLRPRRKVKYCQF